MIQSGGIKALAISTTKRSAVAPDIPTATESGVPNLNFGSWYGVWGPPGLPPEIVKTMNAWVNEAVADLNAEGRLTPLAMEPGSGTPEQFAAFSKTDLARGTELLKSAKFQPE
jgi:tripartite-type tricarboxylate transporter receptor subunit TctC